MEAVMAAARDQAARIIRPEPDTTEGEAARDTSAALAESLRAHVSDETVARRTADAPAIDKPAAPGQAAPAAPKSAPYKN
jgi:membrane fusion protein (multidrug efflux system)